MLEFLTRALISEVKYNLLRAASNGNFEMWKSITEKNITKFFIKIISYSTSSYGPGAQEHPLQKNNGTYRCRRKIIISAAKIIPIKNQLYLCGNGRHHYWNNSY